MPLVGTLEASFGQDGFSLNGAVGALGTSIGGIAPGGATLDSSALGSIAGRIGGVDFGAISTAAGSVAGTAQAAGGALPPAGDLMHPLGSALTTAQTLTGAQTALTSLQTAADGKGGLGLTGLGAQLAALDAARGAPPVTAVLRVADGFLPAGVSLERQIEPAAGTALALAALVRALGALAATETLTRQLTTTAATVEGMLDGDAARATLATLTSMAGRTRLADLLSGVDPNDAGLVEIVAAPIGEFTAAIRNGAAVLVTGMAFGEATLAHAGIDDLAAELGRAASLLDEATLPSIRTATLSLRQRVDPLLALDLGTPAASFDAFWGEVTGLVGELAGAVSSIDATAIARPVANGLDSALAPVREIDRLAHETVASVKSAFEAVRRAVQAVDLRPVSEAINAAIQPAVAALSDLEDLVGEAQTELERVAKDIEDAMTSASTTLGGAATTIHAAYGRIATVIADLHLEDLQQTLQAETQQVADTLRSAQLQPYFDTAVQAMNTAADVVAAVPLGILPDDARTDLEHAVQPIKDIDFDTAIRQTLEGQLHAILDALDTDVLAEVDQAYHEVLAFLGGVNPRGPIEQFEREVFDPMLERVRAIDPTELLRPVADVIQQLKDAIAGLDPASLLAPIEHVFDEIEQGFAQLDPAQLVAPLVAEVDTLRNSILQLTHLDALPQQLARVDPLVTQILGRADFQQLTSLLDSAWPALQAEPGSGTSVVSTIVSGLLEGTGLTIRAESIDTVFSWIGGAVDAGADVGGRLGSAADALQSTLDVVNEIDPQTLTGGLQPIYSNLATAVAALPEDSLLRVRLDPILADSAPLDLLGPAIDNRTRYAAALTAAIAQLRGLASSGRSELMALSQGLRDALRPLVALPDRLRAVLARMGFETQGKSLRALVGEVLAALAPSRVLAPLQPAFDALKAKILELVRAFVDPVTNAVNQLKDAIDALDISFVGDELHALHQQIADEIHGLRPSVLLHDLLAAVDEAKQRIIAFDPLAPVREAVDVAKKAVEDVSEKFRPTVLFAPVLDAYDTILRDASGLDVRQLLAPILDALHAIEQQLDAGLDEAATALTKLQAALP